MSEFAPLNIQVFEPNGRLREPAAAGVRGQLINALNDVYRDHHTADTHPTATYLDAVGVLQTFPDELARLFESDSTENPYWIVAYLLRQPQPEAMHNLLHNALARSLPLLDQKLSQLHIDDSGSNQLHSLIALATVHTHDARSYAAHAYRSPQHRQHAEQQAAALTLIRQHLDTFLRFYLQGHLHPDPAGTVFRTIFQTSSPATKNAILAEIRVGYADGDRLAAAQALGALLGEQVWDPDVRHCLTLQLQTYQLEPEPTIRAWQYAYRSSDGQTAEAERVNRAAHITKHLTSLELLTDFGASVPTTLAARYGIRAFGRYKPAMLFEQFEAREAAREPQQGVVLFPRTDHNGSFFTRGSMLHTMQRQFRGIGQLRIIEADDIHDATQRLWALRTDHGPIDFLLIGGHGTGQSLWLGQNDTLLPENKHLLAMDQLDELPVHLDRRRLFTKHPTIVLWSCTGGQGQGLAQAMSSAYSALVIAPDSVLDDGTIEFLAQPKRSYKTVVTYQVDGKPIPTRQYDRGVPLPTALDDQPPILDEQEIRSAIQQELTEIAQLEP